jgi:hypothetical protein
LFIDQVENYYINLSTKPCFSRTYSILTTFSLQVSFLPFTVAVIVAVPVALELTTPLLTTAT